MLTYATLSRVPGATPTQPGPGFQLLVDERAFLQADSHRSARPEKADDQEVALIQAVSTCETVRQSCARALRVDEWK
jgi:hypothetical protein